MKILDWQRFLAEQKELHGKTIFSIAELANVARTTPHILNTELGRLMGRGLITRYAQGRYGVAHGAKLEEVVFSIDSGAYITGFHVLFQHNLVTQMPSEITCFTDRRHNRKAQRNASVWTLRFSHVPPPIYDPPKSDSMISAEQALCDFVYLSLRGGVQPQHLVTFRNLNRLNPRRLKKLLRRYPGQVALSVERILANSR